MAEFKVGDRVKHAEGEERDLFFKSTPDESGTVTKVYEGFHYPVVVSWDKSGDNHPHTPDELVRA